MNLARKPAFLSEEQMRQIHASSLELLQKKGVKFQSEKARDLLVQNGASADGEIIFIPEDLVARCLAQCPSSFHVNAIDPEKDIEIGAGDLIIHPAGGEVFIKDADDRRLDTSTIRQFSDLQKIYQACPNINMTGYQPLSPEDVPMRTRGMHCLYETMLYTDKPWLSPMDYVSGEDKMRELKMYEIVFGTDYVKSHHLTWSIVTPESPLVYSGFSCESIMEFAGWNQPVTLVSAPMSGITGPVHLAGTMVLANTEVLAGLCLAQCTCPGVPVLPSASLTYGNLRYATWECASPDSALMLGGAVQMYKEFYHLPARAQTGVTSSKLLDYQAGYETMQSLLLTGLMGVDVTSQSAGSMENLMTVSFEKTLIDDEVIARVRRILDGLRIDEETLSVKTIMDIKHGDTYLMHRSTVKNVRKGWQPSISDWNNYDGWLASEYPVLEKKAEARVKEIIENAKPLLEAGIAERLRKYIQEFE